MNLLIDLITLFIMVWAGLASLTVLFYFASILMGIIKIWW